MELKQQQKIELPSFAEYKSFFRQKDRGFFRHLLSINHFSVKGTEILEVLSPIIKNFQYSS